MGDRVRLQIDKKRVESEGGKGNLLEWHAVLVNQRLVEAGERLKVVLNMSRRLYVCAVIHPHTISSEFSNPFNAQVIACFYKPSHGNTLLITGFWTKKSIRIESASGMYQRSGIMRESVSKINVPRHVSG